MCRERRNGGRGGPGLMGLHGGRARAFNNTTQHKRSQYLYATTWPSNGLRPTCYISTL